MRTRAFQGPYRVRARLWWRTRRQGALLLAPFRISGGSALHALHQVSIAPGTRIGQFAWFSLLGPDARVTIGRDCTIGPFLSITCGASVTIGDGTTFAERCVLADHGHDHLSYLEESLVTGETPVFGFAVSEPRPVVIGSGVHLGVNVFISPGVTVGDGAVVGANSVVTVDVPPYTVVAGAPARVLRTFTAGDR